MPSNNTLYTMPAKSMGKAGVLYGLDPADPNVVHAIRVDALGNLVVSGGTGGGGAAVTTDVEMSYFVASVPDSDGTDYAAGDIIKVIEVIDLATATVTSSTWYNVTTNTLIATPDGAEISPKEESIQSTQRQFITDRLQYATGTVTAGALEVSVAVESGFAYIQGTYMPAGYSMTIRAEMQDTVEAINIDASGGSVVVMEIR